MIGCELLFRIFYPLLILAHKRGGYSEDAINRKLGKFEAHLEGNKTIMFHGVSVGEINAIEKLVKKVREEFPNIKIVVTTGTNTGQEIAHKKLGETTDLITYFPFDTPSCVKRFLDNVKPDIVLMAETEIWPNFLEGCKKNGTKVFIINGRISDRTFNSYKKLKFFFKPLLNLYSGIFTQSSEDMNKFLSLGANPDTTERMNNLKFDITAPVVDIELKKEGVNRIYDFRHIDIFGYKFIEKYFCKLFGIKYTRLPYSNLYGQYPDLETFERVSKEVKQNGESGGKSLFHCNSGRHRTSHFSAFYKLTNGQPLSQVKEQYQANYWVKLNEIVKEQILDKNYFSREKIEYNGHNFIKKLQTNRNNKICDGIKRAQDMFLDFLQAKLPNSNNNG